LKNKKGINTILASLLMVVIVVVASVMVYAWSTGLLGTLLVTPTTGKEALTYENSAFNSGTNVTLDIRNAGSIPITLNSYYVKNATGGQWSRLNWQTQGYNIPAAIAPNALGILYVTIGTGGPGTGGSCGAANCTPTGTGFTTFTSGYTYTIVVVTSRNNQFTFQVTR
jgi:hypothetical protein